MAKHAITSKKILLIVIAALIFGGIIFYVNQKNISQTYVGTILFVRNGNELWLMDGNGNYQRKVADRYTRGPSVPWDAAALSHDAQKIVYFAFPNVYIAHSSGNIIDTIPIEQPPDTRDQKQDVSSGVSEFAWSADDAILNYIVSTVMIFPEGDPKYTYATYEYDLAHKKNTTLSDNGATLKSLPETSSIVPDNQNRLAELMSKHSPGDCRDQVFSPDGKVMVYTCEDLDIEPAESGIYRIDLNGHMQQLTSIQETGINADTPIDWQ